MAAMIPGSRQCINSNTDISGIGLRASIYAQALISFAPTFLFIADGRITSHAERVFSRIYVNSLIISYAVIIFAVIQATKSEFTPYHALIVLNLSWINSIGAIVWSFSCFASRRHRSGLFDSFWRHLRQSRLASIQLCMMGCLGIWVWARLEEFGNQSGCTPEILSSLFGLPISVENKHLRYASLVFYSIAAIPFVNLLILLLLFLLLTPVVTILGLLLETHIAIFRDADRTVYAYGVLCGAFLYIIFTLDTELMIRWNQGQVKKKEGVWGFGQTLAILVVIVLSVEVVKELITWYQRRERGFAYWQRSTTATADGSVIHLDDGTVRIYYQGADNHIYESQPGSDSEGTLKDRKISSVEARSRTPIAAISWNMWERSDAIRVYYIGRDNGIREIHNSDGGAEFMNRPQVIAKAARNSGLLYAIANSMVPGTIRLGFNSEFNPRFITEVTLESLQDAQPARFTVPCGNGSATQLTNGYTRIYYQGTDGHLYEHRLDVSRRDRDVSRSAKVPPNTPLVATTWGDNFKHIRVYFVGQDDSIHEICSDYGLRFVDRSRPVGKAIPNSVLLYAMADPKSPGKVTVGFNSASDPALIKEVSFQSAILNRGWLTLWGWIRFHGRAL